MSKCANCGLEGCFCGYYPVGPDKLSLCVKCAEAEIPVWRIGVQGDCKGELIVGDIKAVCEELTVLLGEATDKGEGYTVTLDRMPRLNFMNLGEFEGF